MTVSTEQKVQQKSTRKNKNNNNGTSYANLHITFSHDRYFATNFLLYYRRARRDTKENMMKRANRRGMEQRLLIIITLVSYNEMRPERTL